MCIKDYSWNLSTYIDKNRRHLKHIVDNLGIAWDEIMYVIDLYRQIWQMLYQLMREQIMTVKNETGMKQDMKQVVIFFTQFY